MFTKTQEKIMEIFVSKIGRKFSINEISTSLRKPYPLIHRAIKDLLSKKFILKDEKKLLSLNYKENHQDISYIESLRAKKVLEDDKSLSLFLKDALESLKLDFFILLIFGSYVEKKNPGDIDIILILENEKQVSEAEATLDNISAHFTKKFDFQVISVESAYEMLSKRDKINILNESLNKHLLLFGAENYYRILKNAR